MSDSNYLDGRHIGGQNQSSSGWRITSRQSGGNGKLTFAILAIVIASPIPFGSNRPFFWAMSGIALALIGIGYALNLFRLREAFRFPLFTLKLPVILFFVFLAYLIFQLVPLGPLLGGLPLLEEAGVRLTSPQLSVAPGAGLLMLVRMLAYGIFFYLALQIAINDQRRARILNILLAVIWVYAVIGLASLQFGDTLLGLQKWAYKGSATGTFVNRNSFATFLAFGSIIAMTQIMNLLSELLQRYRDREPVRGFGTRLILCFTAMGTILIAILATQSRMGFFVTFLGNLTIIAVFVLRGTRAPAMLIIMVPLAMIVAAGVLAVFGDGLFERLGTLERSAEIRSNLYAQVVELITQRPIFGWGGGAFEVAFPLVHSLPVTVDLVWDKAHNSYLALWVEFGLIFGSLPIIIYALLGTRLLAGLKNNEGDLTAQTIALGVMVVGALHSLVDFSLEIQANTYMFLMIIALGIAGTGMARLTPKSQ